MNDPLPSIVEGSLVAPSGARFAVVCARFNELVTDQLLSGAQDALRKVGIPAEAITVIKVPGAWELSSICLRLSKSRRFDAIIALGAVIRGSTPHFDYVASEAARGTALAAQESQLPVVFGVLTTDTIEQALERAGTKAGNKGYDAAMTALEMVQLGRELDRHGL